MPTSACAKSDDSFARSRPGRRGGPELSEIGLNLEDPELEFLRGDDTPVNSQIFAHTGGDSVHYCLVEVDGMVTDSSPVVMVVPCCSDEPRLVVGESLREFLALGCVTGFQLLEQLVYDRERALEYLFDYEAYLRHVYPSPAARQEFAAHLQVERMLLGDLSAFFDLTPWPDPGRRLHDLQERWQPTLRIEQSEPAAVPVEWPVGTDVKPVERRIIPLGSAQGGELLEVRLAGSTATVVLRGANAEPSEMVFEGVEHVTNRGAEGMVVERLTEHLRLGGAIPSRFVFENQEGSRSLAISAKATRGPLS